MKLTLKLSAAVFLAVVCCDLVQGARTRGKVKVKDVKDIVKEIKEKGKETGEQVQEEKVKDQGIRVKDIVKEIKENGNEAKTPVVAEVFPELLEAAPIEQQNQNQTVVNETHTHTQQQQHVVVKGKGHGIKEKKAEKLKKEEKLKEERLKEEEKLKEEERPKERIVTEFMLLRKGVPLDYSYNETASLPGDIVSSPGCPKSIDGYPWVLYGDEPKCYLVGQHSAVCEGSSVMSYQKSSYYGVCGCNFQDCIAKQTETDVKGYQLLRRIMSSSSSRYTFCHPSNVFCEEYVYDRKEKRCHILYSQGPCYDSEWLQRDGKGGVECSRRLCPGGKGLTSESEKQLLTFRNVTQDTASCCKPWGGFAVALSLRKTECKHGESYSDTLQRCVVMPFKASSLVIG